MSGGDGETLARIALAITRKHFRTSSPNFVYCVSASVFEALEQDLAALALAHNKPYAYTITADGLAALLVRGVQVVRK